MGLGEPNVLPRVPLCTLWLQNLEATRYAGRQLATGRREAVLSFIRPLSGDFRRFVAQRWLLAAALDDALRFRFVPFADD